MAYDSKPDAPVEYMGRKGEGQMDDDDFRSVVARSLAECVQFVDTELSPDRSTASDYYRGAPFGNEEEGRSQVVLTELRDAVDGMLPSALRVFFSAEHAVEFAPNKAAAVEQAAQMTDYVRYVFEEDNGGFLETLAVWKDALIRKVGVFKWGWDDSVDVKNYKQEGISLQQLQLLASDDEIDFTKGSIQEKEVQGQEPTFDVEFTRTRKSGRAWVKALPPEEFVFNRQARDDKTALVLGHRTEKTRGELIAMGVKEKDLDEHATPGEANAALHGNAEELARRNQQVTSGSTTGYGDDPDMGEANGKILYVEALMKIDFDGDGIAELRRVCTIGSAYWPVKNVPADETMGFAVFTPYPEPHTLVGGSVADRTMDVQKINSALLRGMLDSLSISIFPRTAYLEGQASVADIMNTAIGAPMRERVAGAIRPIVTPFVGKEAMPILGFMQDVIEQRTGRRKGAQGLDADALQSTGKEAVSAVLNGNQEQLEMLCRVFAEMTLKPLFKGLGRLLAAKQPRSRVVRLRGQWVEIDPRTWDLDMDVTVNVGLGSTFTDKKIATLMAVGADQKDILTTMGMQNPLVTLPMLRNTRAKILALQGIKDADSYYQPLPPNWQPPAPAAPPPDPEALWVQAEKEMAHTKAMKELAIKADELALKREQMTWEQEFKLRELAVNEATKRYAIEAQFHGQRTAAELEAEVERDVQEAKLTMAAHDQLHDQAQERDAQSHDQQMAVRAADTADTQAAQPTETA